MKLQTVIIVLLSLFSLTAVGVIVAKVHRPQTKQGFTLVITQTAYPADLVPVLTATKVRYQRSDGSWRTETTYANGHRDVGFGQIGRGVFRVDEKNQRLDYLSGSTGGYAEYATNENTLRSDPNFVREETISGFNTFHIHSDSPETGQYVDSYICPMLQGYPLRVVSGDSKGNRTVFEVTKVILGEPSFDVPNYPVDMRHYEAIQGHPPSMASSPQ